MPTKDRRRRSRGAALIEGALVFPVVAFVVFGIIETGVFFSTSSTTNNAARAGARYGASNFATSSNRQVAADEIRDEVVEALDALTGYGTPLTLWIYEADPLTGEPADPSACTTSCFRYSWNGSTFAYQGGTWATGTPGEADACVGGTSGNANNVVGGVDSIGVRLQVSYRTVSDLISARTITHRTTMRLEPLPFAQCATGA
jgi:hypothetical protein